MRQITPYCSSNEMLRALDNGGRFYHLLCRKGDGKITSGELATASKSSPDRIGAYVYLAMKSMLLPDEDREAVFEKLTPKLRQNLELCWPLVFTAAEVERHGILNAPAIVTGFATGVERQGRVIGNTIWTYSSGRASVMAGVPIMSAYSVYEFHDSENRSGDSAVVAATKRSKLLAERIPYVVGGVLVELIKTIDNVRTHQFVLHAKYCLDATGIAA